MSGHVRVRHEKNGGVRHVLRLSEAARRQRRRFSPCLDLGSLFAMNGGVDDTGHDDIDAHGRQLDRQCPGEADDGAIHGCRKARAARRLHGTGARHQADRPVCGQARCGCACDIQEPAELVEAALDLAAGQGGNGSEERILVGGSREDDVINPAQGGEHPFHGFLVKHVQSDRTRILGGSSDIVTDGLPRDPLSELLQDLRLSGVSYGRCELRGPWGIRFPQQAPARFHFIATRDAWLQLRGRVPAHLASGDAVLLPRGTTHALTHRPRGRAKPLESFPLEEIGDRTYRLSAGEHGEQTLLFCCSVTFDDPAVHAFLELMPTVVLVRGAAKRDARLHGHLEAMAEEVVGGRVGSATVLTRLADLVIARILRTWLESEAEDSSGWLAALRDPRIGRALAAIHRSPGEDRSVETLARIANMSRSVFAERFAAVAGMPVARYVARWRMHLASRWLRSDHIKVAEAAERLGYESEASFSRAFKRVLGFPPSALRRVGRS